MAHVVVDQIKPQDILKKIGSYQMAFAESYKGDGGPSDANFQQFDGSWHPTLTEAREIWLEMFKRNVVRAGVRAGYNFCEFWGWPEIRCRDNASYQVAARLRVVRVKIPHVPRIVQ